MPGVTNFHACLSESSVPADEESKFESVEEWVNELLAKPEDHEAKLTEALKTKNLQAKFAALINAERDIIADMNQSPGMGYGDVYERAMRELGEVIATIQKGE